MHLGIAQFSFHSVVTPLRVMAPWIPLLKINVLPFCISRRHLQCGTRQLASPVDDMELATKRAPTSLYLARALGVAPFSLRASLLQPTWFLWWWVITDEHNFRFISWVSVTSVNPIRKVLIVSEFFWSFCIILIVIGKKILMVYRRLIVKALSNGIFLIVFP